MADLELAGQAGGTGREPFEIVHHGARCCMLARTWLERIDATFHRGRAAVAPPAWIGHRFVIEGETRALHWCEIPDAALSDAAAAALARALWILRCDGVCAVQLAAGPVYREAAGRVHDERLEIWDCAAGVWVRPAGSATLAVRVTGAGAASLRWGDQHVAAGEWVAVQTALPLSSHGSRRSLP